MQPNLTRVLTGVVVASFVAAPSFANMAPPPELLAERAVRDADTELLAAIAGKDAAKVAGYYADDAAVLPPGAPPVEGREAIQAFWASVFATPGVSLRSEIAHIKISYSGDMAITHGPYMLTIGEGEAQTVEHGKFVVTWVVTDEGWKIYTDMFSSNGPMPPQAAQAGPPRAPLKAE